jgi:hypothetical protein
MFTLQGTRLLLSHVFLCLPNRSHNHTSYQLDFYWKLRMPPHSSLMKPEAFHLWRGGVERNSFSLWSELRIIRMAHRVTHPFTTGPWAFLSCSIRRPNLPLHEHEVPFRFIIRIMLIQDISKIYLPLCQGTATRAIISGFSIIDAL